MTEIKKKQNENWQLEKGPRAFTCAEIGRMSGVKLCYTMCVDIRVRGCVGGGHLGNTMKGLELELDLR